MKFYHTVRVYYEDTDLAGIVYYANYLKFIERARSEMVRDAGIDQVALKADHGLVFAVTRVEADYLKPAKFDDLLVVETSITQITPARFVMQQIVRRDETPLFQASITLACLHETGRARPVPEAIKSLLAD